MHLPMQLPNSSTQIKDEEPLYLVIEIIVLANKLKIPEMSLQSQLKKAAIRYARQSVIGEDHISMIYDESMVDYLGESEHLREAAGISILEKWWSRVLDEPKYDEYCSFVEQMRAKFPKFDEDINKRFDDKVEYREQKRQEKRQDRLNGDGGGNGSGGNNQHDGIKASSVADYPETTGPDGGWGDATAAVADVVDAHIDEWGLGGGSAPVDSADNAEPALEW